MWRANGLMIKKIMREMLQKEKDELMDLCRTLNGKGIDITEQLERCAVIADRIDNLTKDIK